MKKYQVELSITQTFTTKVIVEGEFTGLNDPNLFEVAKDTADNMNHDCWDYQATEVEVNSTNKLPDFKVFSVGDDLPEYIVAMTKEEALSDHLNRVGLDYYGEDEPIICEMPLNQEGRFETENGYKTMTFAQFLGDFIYREPQLICWNE